MRRAAALTLLVAAAGCGDPLVDSSFRGEPLFSFTGQMATFQGLGSPEGDVRASLFWGAGDWGVPAADLMEQDSVSASLEFPSKFSLTVFHPPEAGHLPGGEPYGVAALLVYDDKDRDGRYDAGDRLMGGSENRLMVYATRDLRASDSPIGQPLERGFRLLPVPQYCERVPPEFDDEDDLCGVDVGAPCRQDSDCGAEGHCLTEVEDLSFQGGYCTLLAHNNCWDEDDEDETEFEPPWEEDEDHEDAEFDFVYKPCATDSDCRVDEGYICHGGFRACVPDEPVFLDLHADFQTPELCVDEGPFPDEEFDPEEGDAEEEEGNEPSDDGASWPDE